MTLAAELFSRSIAKGLEGDDLRLLETSVKGGGEYELRVTNEALETHYINSFSVIAVSHPPGTTVLPRAGGGLSCFSHPVPPLRAFNRTGQNVLDLVKSPDGSSYRSGTESFRKVKDGEIRDWVEMNVRVPEGSRSATMVVKKRNTLLSTVLLYDVVLGSQGMRALEWTEKMNSDQEYAGRFKSVYEAFSGITVQTLSDHGWIWQSLIPDTGPIAWNWIAVEIPLASSRDLSVRLEFFPDNFMIDYVGFAFSRDEDTTVVELRPANILDNHGVEKPEIAALIEKDDDQYLVTNPGESYRLRYQLPVPDARSRTLFVRSRGYYNEWIRGEWLTMDRAGYRFDLDDLPGTISQLTQSWLRDRETVERAFWEARIPVKEDP